MRASIGKILVAEGTAGVKVNTPIAVTGRRRRNRLDAARPVRPPRPHAGRGCQRRPRQWQLPGGPGSRRRHGWPRPDWPEGTAMKTMTVREALREAMAEEMRADPTVFLMGEEVGEYQGAYKISQGLLDEFGAKRVIDTPITEHGFAGHRGWRRLGRAEADRRVHDLQLLDAGDRPYPQLGRQDTVHVGRSDGHARSCSAARTVLRRGWGPSTARTTRPGMRRFRACEVAMPYSAADAKGLLKTAIRDPNPVIFLENEILYGRVFEVPEIDGFHHSLRQGPDLARGRRRDHRVLRHRHGACAGSGGHSWRRTGISAEVIDLRTLRPDRLRHGAGIGDEDQPLRDGRGRLARRLDRQPHWSARSCSGRSTIWTRR